MQLDQLTPEQERRLPEIAAEWTAIGLSTAPADRPTAEQAIRQMYQQAGLAAPRIVWCGSPLSQGLTRHLVRVWGSVRDSAWASVRASVWVSVRDSVRDSVWDSVRASVGASVWDSVWDSVGASVWASVWDSVYGQHDAGWLASYDAFRRFGLVDQTAPLAGLIALAKSAGWALPHERVCWVSERHHALHRDDRGRLHAADGPALAYSDGFAIHAWHGVRVPARIIETPDTITSEEITAEPNAEVRRVMLERFGADRYIRELGAERVQGDDYGSLYRVERVDDSPLVMVHVTNSTPEPDGSAKDYWLRVPPEMQSAREAVAWTFQVDNPEDYAPTIET